MDSGGLEAGLGSDTGVNGVANDFMAGDIEFSVIPSTNGDSVKDDGDSLVNALGISNSEGIELGMPSGDDDISMNVPELKVDGSDSMEVDTEEGVAVADAGPLEKLRSVQLLPELFNLLHDLRNGTLLAKDFGSNAGSLRLKLTTFKQCLQEIEGINESIEQRQQHILTLTKSRLKKEEFLASFKHKIKQDLEELSLGGETQ